MKKTEQQTYRLSEQEKSDLAEIADELGIPAASLVGTLAARFVKARKQHGNRLIWPPEFNYYPAGTQSVQGKEDSISAAANTKSVRKAG